MKKPLFMMPKPLQKLWETYRYYVESVMQPPQYSRNTEDDYISNRLFTNSILYGLPAALLVIITGICFNTTSGFTFLSIYGKAILAFVAITALNPWISINYRKLFASSALVLTAVILTASRGAFGIASIYLITFSVFYALHIPGKFAIRAMVANIIICIIFGLNAAFSILPISLVKHVPVREWITYSVNFLFLNLVIVVMVRQTISRLQRTMQTEATLYEDLKNEFNQKQLLNDSLLESETRYRTLFTLSPSAKLIFDIETLRFLETNNAATTIYGYSEEEFLLMNLTDINPAKNASNVMKNVSDANHVDGTLAPIRAKHLRKDGTLIDIELLRSNIIFNGKPARLIVVNDISNQVKQVNAIKKQNEKLRDIAYIQSHEIRLPLTKIMALTDLIADEFTGKGDEQLLTSLSRSAEELDMMIRKIVAESEGVLGEFEE